MEKRCNKCQEDKDILEFRTRVRNGKIYHRSICKTCDKKRIDHLRSTSEKSFCSARIAQIRNRCKADNLPFNLTNRWMLRKLNGQKWKCALTGIPMVIRCSDPGHWNSVSADRINPNRGYTTDNVRFVIHQVNVFKGCEDDDHMFFVAKQLLRNTAV